MPLLLVGAGHVFRIEDPIRFLIQQERPDVVALELDAGRYQGLLQRAAGTFDAEAAAQAAPRLYRALARFQSDIADSLGTDVGGEMMAAARAAQGTGSRIALIDRPADQVVQRLWDEMKFRERARLFFSALAARLPWRRAATVEQEVARYQADPGAYLAELGETYPTLKRVLIDERNDHMAAQLRALVAANPKVVAVVGDGHVDGLLALLKDLAPRAVRLADLRRVRPHGLQWTFSSGGDRVAFSFDQQSLEGALAGPG